MTTVPVPEKLFARKATGLVREIGTLTAIIIILANTIGLGWQKRVFQFTGPSAVPENTWPLGLAPITVAFLLGGIGILLSTLCYAALSSAMPRSGGGYVVISRIFSPFLGVVSSWVEFLAISISFGLIAVAVFEALWLIFGPLAGISAPVPSEQIPTVLLIGGIVIIVLFTAIGSLGVRLTGAFLQVMFWIPAALTVYILYLLASGAANPSVVAAGVTSFTGASPEQYVQVALANGMRPTTDYVGAVSNALVGAYWAYIGYAAATFVAGEVKEANRNLPKILFIGGIVIMLTYLIISTLTTAAMTPLGKTPDGQYSFFTAYAWLRFGEQGNLLSQVSPGAISPWTSTIAAFAGIGLGLQSFNILILIFAVFWVANDIPPFILTASRVVFAMSFDRVFPSTLANVSERFHSPVNAVVLTGLVAIFGALAESDIIATAPFVGPIISSAGAVTATDLMDGLFFTLFALALVLFPYRRKDIFETAPWKPGGRAGLVALGLAALIANLYFDWVFLTAPAGAYDLLGPGFASYGVQGLAFVISLALIGAVVYAYYRGRAKTTGIDYTTIFTQIPPE